MSTKQQRKECWSCSGQGYVEDEDSKGNEMQAECTECSGLGCIKPTPSTPKLHIRFFNNDDGDGEVIIGPLDGINQDFRGLMRLQFPSKEACDAAFPNHSGRIEDDVVELSVDGVGIVLPHPVKGYKHYYQRWDIFLKE